MNCYDQTGQCGCPQHRTVRRYHYHRVFDDGEIDAQPFGAVWIAFIYGMAFEKRKITHCVRIETAAARITECGFCRCT